MMALSRNLTLGLGLMGLLLTSCATMTLSVAGPVLPMLISSNESAALGPPPNADRSLEAGKYNIMYANAFVAGPAEYLPSEQVTEKRAAQTRALALYLRGRDQVFKTLDLRYPGFAAAWASQETQPLVGALAQMTKSDVPALYWSAAGHFAAFSASPLNVELSFLVPKALALVLRAYELDPDFQGTTLDELLVSLYSSLPTGMGGDPKLAKRHYDRAVAKSHGSATGAFLAWATGVDVPAQNKDEFVDLLTKVLAVDAEAQGDSALGAVLNQKKARWLLEHVDDYFL
jgi:predicted anti-sigma-YlaC factor YlaD